MEKTNHLNIVVLGHTESGKSTTIGHLLVKTGEINEKTFDECKVEAQKTNQEGLAFAWLLDKLKVERERKMTINNTMKKFSTKTKQCSIIDVPGHRNLIKHMISGTIQADVAILIVSAATGEGSFETGYSSGGQTREHALLAFTLGIKEILVGVTKMDHESVNWKEERFNEIKNELIILLTMTGFRENNISFIPFSGLKGDNLKDKSINMPWYTGLSFLDSIDKMTIPVRLSDKPLRLPITIVYKIKGVGIVPFGKIETGILQTGTVVKFSPYDLTSVVDSIQMHQSNLEIAAPGNIVGFKLNNSEITQIKRGFVCSDAKNDPAKECIDFEAQVIILNHPKIIKNGYQPILYIHSVSVACKFVHISAKINIMNGEITEENPNSIKKGDCAIINIKPNKPICVESFKDYPALGRFIIRDMQKTIAVGIIKHVNKKETKE